MYLIKTIPFLLILSNFIPKRSSFETHQNCFFIKLKPHPVLKSLNLAGLKTNPLKQF